MSDVYNQNDNPVNPYSQFSEVGSDSVYKGRSEEEVNRRKKALTAGLVRFEKTPEYIKTKQAQNLKSNLLVATTLKQDMCLVCTEGLKRLQHDTCCVLRATSLPDPKPALRRPHAVPGSTSLERRARLPGRRPGTSPRRSRPWVWTARTRSGAARRRTAYTFKI